MVPALQATFVLRCRRLQVIVPPAFSVIPATQLKKTDMPPFTIVLGWGPASESPTTRA